MSDRRITVVTGTRAEYGLLRPSMRAIEADDELDLSVVATGMHLSPRHGYTVNEIRADGFTIDHELESLLDGDTGRSMAKSLSLSITGLADALAQLNPDVVMVLGDRGEALAGGVAAAHMNIPVAHVHGGDAMAGATIDDSIRHALTKFAHLHFPVTPRSASRIRSMGEAPWRVTTVGAPGLDDILEGGYVDAAAVGGELGIDPEDPIVVVLQHPLTTAPEKAGDQMRATLDAVADVEAQRVIIYPNADAGAQAMIEEITGHKRADQFVTFQNLPRETYLGLLDAADVLVGNSSSGIIEAPSLGLTVVDIGPRQRRRERAANVTSVPHEVEAIREGVTDCLTDDDIRNRARTCENPYDRGGAADRIVETLRTTEVGEQLLQKEFVDPADRRSD